MAPTTSQEAKQLSKIIGDLRRRMAALERAPRLAHASIEGQPLPVYDGTQVLRQTIGQQPDGTYTVVDVNGAAPPVPSAPTIEVRAGTLVVTWDGTFVDGAPAPLDWDHVEVHVYVEAGYIPTDATQVATFNSLKGGSVTLALDPVEQFVKFQAVNTSKVESDPSTEISATPLPVATGDGGIKTYYETTPPLGLDADDDGSLWYDTNDDNHPYRWDGPTLQWVTVRDGSIAAAASAAAAAQTAAAGALTAAQAAQATADGSIRTFYQSSAPWANGSSQPPEVVGDLWFDTDDGQAYRWSGTNWVIIEDNSIAAALAAAMNAQTTADGKITSYYQTATPVIGELGDLWFDTDDLNKPYYCSSISPLTWTPIRDGAIAVAQATADDALDAATTDGLAPTASPDPLVLYGLGMFIVRWTPIINADAVTYEVHMSTALGFTPTAGDPTTLVGTTNSSQFTVRALPGPDPAPGDPDPRALNYDATYYVRIIARDDDGAAPYSLQSPAGCLRVTGVDLAVDSVTAANILAGTLTGELFSASVIVAGTFKTGETGQRVEWGVAGIKGYKPDGSLMVSFPTEDGEEALFDGEMIARGLTVLGGASFSGDSEMTAAAVWTLMRGITAPSASPQLSVSYDAVQPSTASLAAVDKTGPDLGVFDLVASEVTCIEWRAGLSCFSMYQIRPGGTREWFIDTTGAPVNVPSVGYFMDWADWEIWSATEILSNPIPAKIGHYLMFRYIPSGTDYYCYTASGTLLRYSRQNSLAAPVMGNNGTDVYVAEVIQASPGTHLSIRYFNLIGASGNFPAATTAYESTQGFIAAQPLACVTNGTFDVGARYLAASRGVSTKAWLLVTNGTNANSIFPGSTSNNWGSANVDAETFEAPGSNRRGMAWDGTQFWSLHGDGFLYKHTGERWDPAVASSTYWGKPTFYDSNATGGTHETAPGPAKSYTAKRRSKNTFVPPTIPVGGTNDPDRVRLYMARGATLPANGSFHLQYEGSVATAFTTLATATAIPPTTGNFPNGTPAKIRNDDDTLVISGDGTIKAVTLSEGADRVAIRGPYWMGHLNANTGALTSGVNLLIQMTEDEKSAAGFTYAAGVLTIGRSGMYDILAVLCHNFSNTTGGRLSQIYNAASTPLASDTVPPTSSGTVTARAINTVRLAAGDTLRVFGAQTSGLGTATIAGNASGNLSYFRVKWAGP